jgi:hypothetical protein
MSRNGVVKLVSALVLACLLAVFSAWRFDGDFEQLLLIYFTPITVPFVALLFDLRALAAPRSLQILDIAIILVSMARAVIPIPFISGHALFLVYALLRTHSWLTRILCLIVLGQVMYLKLWVWHDSTFWGGLLVGVGAFLLSTQLARKYLTPTELN